MATRDSDFVRDRYGRRYSEEDDRFYEPRSRDYGSRRREDRGFVDRATDEIRSWLGDDEAERRRRTDDRRRSVEDRIYRSGERLTDLRAADLMTRDVVSVHPADTVERAARLMRECDCGAIPVVNDEGELIGMITDRDVVVRLIARGADVRRSLVDDAMTDDTFSCHADDSIERCMRAMARHQIRRLPIVDDRDRLVGIISQSDLAQCAGMHPGRGERRAIAEVLREVSEPSGKPYR